MIQELSIRDFAIISSLTLSFDEGMTVLTGETGAGKSIIIDAMGLLTGGRGSSDYIRQGANKCVLEGLFLVQPQVELLNLLAELGIEMEDNTLILQRDISSKGKNVCRVNGRMVNTANLRRVGEFLVDIHGQNEHQELMRADKHLDLLDEYGRKTILPLKNDYLNAYQTYRSTQKKVNDRRKNEKDFAQRVDMLRYQSDEIEAAQLDLGEEERLKEERLKLVNHQKIAEALSLSYNALESEEGSSLDRIGQGMNSLLEIGELDEEYARISEVMQNGYYLLQEAASDLSRQLDHLEMDENRLDEVEIRLELIHQLKRKYGETIEGILSYYDTITRELADASFLEGGIEELEALLKKQKEEAIEKARLLSLQRKVVAEQLEKGIHEQFQGLYMEKAIFSVKFMEPAESLTFSGCDQVEFYISTNPGEPLKPLIRVASGGEMSRIMLALKTMFSKTQGVTSIVFDEVDTGVSGRVAQAIADKIHQISNYSQVLCITHLPQVAASADTQYHIQKKVTNGRTETTVLPLDKGERVLEIARMLAGSEVTDLTIEHARELLRLAHPDEKI